MRLIPDDRLQQLIASKDADAAFAACQAHGYNESWSIIDGALVIYDLDDAPSWLAPALSLRDEDGNTGLPSISEQPDGFVEAAAAALRSVDPPSA